MIKKRRKDEKILFITFRIRNYNNDCIHNNLCYKADAQLQRVYVNEYAWRASAFDDKESIAMFFLKYTKARNNRAVFVEIMSSNTGKKIGTYNYYNGYKEK